MLCVTEFVCITGETEIAWHKKPRIIKELRLTCLLLWVKGPVLHKSVTHDFGETEDLSQMRYSEFQGKRKDLFALKRQFHLHLPGTDRTKGKHPKWLYSTVSHSFKLWKIRSEASEENGVFRHFCFHRIYRKYQKYPNPSWKCDFFLMCLWKQKPLYPTKNWHFSAPVALDETIVPPDVPSYLSSQGTLSDRQDVVVRVENQQPNGHIDSNGENPFNWFFCNAVSELDTRREKSQNKVLLCLLWVIRKICLMSFSSCCIYAEQGSVFHFTKLSCSCPLPIMTVHTSRLLQKLLSQALRTIFLLILD